MWAQGCEGYGLGRASLQPRGSYPRGWPSPESTRPAPLWASCPSLSVGKADWVICLAPASCGTSCAMKFPRSGHPKGTLAAWGGLSRSPAVFGREEPLVPPLAGISLRPKAGGGKLG